MDYSDVRAIMSGVELEFREIPPYYFPKPTLEPAPGSEGVLLPTVFETPAESSSEGRVRFASEVQEGTADAG